MTRSAATKAIFFKDRNPSKDLLDGGKTGRQTFAAIILRFSTSLACCAQRKCFSYGDFHDL